MDKLHRCPVHHDRQSTYRYFSTRLPVNHTSIDNIFKSMPYQHLLIKHPLIMNKNKQFLYLACDECVDLPWEPDVALPPSFYSKYIPIHYDKNE